MVRLRALWLEAPWTLQVYIGAGAVLGILGAVLSPGAWRWLTSVLGLLLCYFLLRRVRWLWLLDIGLTSLSLVVYLIARGTNAAFMLAALLLLLAAPARRHFDAGNRATGDGVSPS